MPIGVPRIIYCWGEEVPAQWTDIYNFIFRRRMVFLMQYLDDELCNQICGLLINIHMEDRSKELEKKEMEKSGLFKAPVKQKKSENSSIQSGSLKSLSQNRVSTRPQKLIEDLMISEQDLGIDENYSLERYTLQKMTLEWLNWNAQFFDYSEEPYLFYLAEILSKDFSTQANEGRLYYDHDQTDLDCVTASVNSIKSVNSSQTTELNQRIKKQKKVEFVPNQNLELSKLMMMFKSLPNNVSGSANFSKFDATLFDLDLDHLKHFDVYSPFRLLANLVFPEHNNLTNLKKNTDLATEYSTNFESCNETFRLDTRIKNQLAQKLKDLQKHKMESQSQFLLLNEISNSSPGSISNENLFAQDMSNQFSSLVTDLSQRNLFASFEKPTIQMNFTEKAFTQKQLRREYKKTTLLNSKSSMSFNLSNKNSNKTRINATIKPASYLNGGSLPSEESYMEFRDYYRKQTESALQEEEAKKVFMIINSFGGSVGNGITVHDALQFIKAGSLTLALGVAASAASLALAGGTIGERYVTEGCHTMIHQPEGGLQGQASDIWIDSQEIMKIRLDVAEIYSLSTYRPRHKILRDLDRDFYLTATETIFYGLADEIATNEVMHEIISMTSAVWDYHDSQQQRLLESRESANAAADTQTQN
nr:proteolytic subunit 2 of clp protease [Microspora sp. UTEX LB472]